MFAHAERARQTGLVQYGVAVGHGHARPGGGALDQHALRERQRGGAHQGGGEHQPHAARAGFLCQQFVEAHLQISFLPEDECRHRQHRLIARSSRSRRQGPGIGDPVARQFDGLFIDDRFAPEIELAANPPGKR